MTKETQLRDEALKRFQERAKAKYDRGQATYHDYLVDRVEWDDLEDEIIDQWFYLAALKKKVEIESGRSPVHDWESAYKDLLTKTTG